MRLQIALDYLIVFSFVLFIFVLVLASIARQRVLVSNEQTFSQLQLVAQSVASELSSAAQAGNGYSASILLPPQLSVLQYNIYVTRQGMVIASSNTLGQNVQATAFGIVQNVVSNASYLSGSKLYYQIPTIESGGYMTLQNSFGTICIDYTCPSTSSQARQISLTDIVAHGFSFNGKTTALYLPTPVTTSTKESITFWIKTPVPGKSNQYVVDQGASYSPNNNWIDISQGRIVGGPSLTSECGSNLILQPNTWYFVAYTSSSSVNIYVNGSQSLGCSISGTTGTVPTSLNIGQLATGSSKLNGTIADMQIYDVAISSHEVSKLYSEGISGQPVDYSHNVAWYQFNGNVNDSSGNGNNLTTTGVQLFPAIAQILANVYNASGVPLPNATVGFVTTSGSFSTGASASSLTNSNGTAQTFLNSANSSDYAVVKAVAFNGNQSTANNLTAWWPMVYGSGTTLYDLSSRSDASSRLNGNIVGAYWPSPTYVLRLYGSTGIVSIPSTSGLQSNPITISAWASFEPPTSGQDFVASAPGSWAFGACTDKLVVCFYNPSGSLQYSNTILNPGQWYMLSETLSGSNAIVYVDGSQVATGTSASYFSGSAIEVGGQSGMPYSSSPPSGQAILPQSFFNGSISNLQIYGSAMSSTALTALYDRGIGASPNGASLHGWWPLNGNANDYSGKGTNGSILGNAGFVRLPTSAAQASSTSAQVLSAGFNGNSMYINGTGIYAFPISNAQWIYPKSYGTSDFEVISEFDGGGPNAAPYELALRTNGEVVLWDGNTNLVSSLVAPLGTWSFVGYTLTASSATIYVNGKSQTFSLSITPTASSNQYWILGWQSRYTTRYFNGNMANVQAYNSTLSSSQMSQLYRSGIAGLPIAGAKLAGWWPLNGDTNDYGLSNEPGTPYNGISYSQAVSSAYIAQPLSGSGLVFNGTGSNVVVTGNLVINGPFAVSAWVNPSASSGREVIAGKQNTFRLGLGWNGNSEGDFYAYVGGTLLGPVSTPYPLDYNQWSMLTGVYNGTYLTLYEDGVPVNTIAASGSIATNSNPLVIGASETSGYSSNSFSGSIAGIQVYNTSLTSAQVYQLYNTGTPASASITIPLGVS